jgi:DNA-binding LytR/AlgR family response regulator
MDKSGGLSAAQSFDLDPGAQFLTVKREIRYPRAFQFGRMYFLLFVIHMTSTAYEFATDVKSDYKIHKIAHSDIDVIEAYGEYILIYSGRQKIMTLGQMGKIEQVLHKPAFVRVHRSFIVNFSKIDAIQGGTIYIGERQVPLSKGYRDGFMELVQKAGCFKDFTGMQSVLQLNKFTCQKFL